VNRPNIGNNTGNAVNRPNIGNNTGNAVNRSNIGNNTGNVVNRPNIGNNTGNVINRPNIGNNTGNIVNRPNIGTNVNVGINNRPGATINTGNININNSRNINNINMTNLNRPGWATGNPSWAYRPGWAYHQGWVNGYWHGQNNNWWNNWGGVATGLALGGIGAWGIGSSIYNWGYRPYVNPYVVAAQPVVIQQAAPATVVVQQPASLAAAPPVDYSQPISSASPPPEPAVADPAIQTFDAARAAFMAGNYSEALQKTDEALKTLPNDAAMHEFRALCLFALKQYDQAAATLYAVLSAGPGWDWTTLSGLYPNVDVYTSQVRALEDYSTANPQSAQARFVLAYHYLTQGHAEAAAEELREVVKLQPADQLSAQLLAQLSASQTQTTPGATPPAAPSEGTGTPPAVTQGNLAGAWKASPAPGTTIELTLGSDSKLQWNIVTQGRTQQISGNYTFENGILTLTQSESNAMVGKVSLQDEGHFTFQAMGGGPGDPGLAFSR
jgi:tetratricopeptide (TPR) repeat protein